MPNSRNEQSSKQLTLLDIQFKVMHNLNFGGNPLVLQLLQQPNTQLDKFLDVDSFPSQFRTCNPRLQKYMDITKYNKLIEYVTEIGDPANRNRSYRYPLMAAEILSIQNQATLEAIFREGRIVVKKVHVEERWVEKEVDQCDSQYCSSEGSGQNMDEFFENSDRENIPPETEKTQIKGNNRVSLDSKKKSDKNSDSSSQGRRSLGASSASITSDDFPFAQQTVKKIKVKQVITRQTETEIKPLLTQLCQFYQKQVNHTLTGYVTKILETLLKKNPRRLLRQFFTTKTHKFLIKHLESHVAADFVINMLLCSENQVENVREYFLGMLIKRLVSSGLGIDKDGDPDDQAAMILNKSILYVLMEVCAKLDPSASNWHAVLMEYLYQEPSLPKIAPLLFDAKTSNKNKEIYLTLYLNLLKKLINPIIINPPNTAPSSIKTSQQQRSKQLRQKLLTKFQSCFKQFIQKVWQNLLQTSDSTTTTCWPSYIHIKQLQILNTLIKHDLFWSRMQLSNQQNIFVVLMGLCRKFRNNNFVHNQVFQLLREIVHSSTSMPILFNKVFNCKNFVSFCLETVSQNGANAMYRGHCIYLCQAIKHSNSQQSKSLKTEYKTKWQKIQQNLSKNMQKINSTLGGYSIKRPHKVQIQFTKEQILTKFQHFLKGELPIKSPKNKEQKQCVQEQLQEELGEISTQAAEEWSDWSQFSNYQMDQVEDKKEL